MTIEHDCPFNQDLGTLTRAPFASSDTFETEQQKIFKRAWCFVGHESQVPQPNDFFASRIGTDRVVLTRDRQGVVHVLLNTCRHRGMRVVRYDEGNAPVFTCPYHAWSYSTDGRIAQVPGQLVGVQAYKTAYGDQLDKTAWGLVNARTAIYKGAVFACWDPDAPSLEEYLGDMRWYLDALLDGQDGTEGGTEVIAGVIKWQFNSNWKAAAENFIGDYLHGVSHRSVEMVGIGPGGVGQSRSGLRSIQDEIPYKHVSFPSMGHGVAATEPYNITDRNADIYPDFLSKVAPLDQPEVVHDYYREMAAKRLENLRGKPQVAMRQITGGVFPNMSFHTTFPRTIAVWHPVAPGVTEGWRWCIVDSAAPQEVKDLVRHHFMRYSGPAGLTEQDDMENWAYLTEATAGRFAREFDFNYQAGLATQRPSQDLSGAVVTDSLHSESNIRSFYSAWQRHMSSDSWSDYVKTGVQ